MPENPSDSTLDRTDRRALGILLTGNVLFAAGLIVHAVLFNFYLRELGHTASAMGYQVAAMTIGGLAGLIPAGWLIDTRGTRTALLTGGATTAIGLVVTAVTRSLGEVYAAAFIVGVGGATCRVAFGPAIMRFTTDATRSRMFAWNTALLIGSSSFWTIVAGLLSTSLVTTYAFAARLSPMQLTLVIGALITACSLPLYAMLPSTTRAPAAAERVPLLPPTEVRVSIALVALWMLAAALVLPFFNIWFTDRFAMSVPAVTRTFAAAQLATAVLLVFGGEAARRFGARRVLIAWLALMAPALLGLSMVGALGAAVTLYFVQGVVAPATNPLIDQLLLERAPAERHGIVAGWRNAAAESSGALGATIGGQLLDATSFATLFVVAAGVAAVSAFALTVSFKPYTSPRTAA